MGKVIADITTSLDGFVAGPNQSREIPLGESGERLHDWAIATASWREMQGREGGEDNADSAVIAEAVSEVGATVMGRHMFGGGEGPWGSDPDFGDPWIGWWGEEPPFHHPVFVLTHHAREPLSLSGTTFYFVTEGVGSAIAQAREAAGEANVSVAGGAQAIQQSLAAGLVDEMQIHVAPILLGGGARLFENLGPEPPRLEQERVIGTPAVTHIRYRVVK